ncbi:LTA synthase family protein, partial [Treponema sp. R6D11]
MKYVFIPKIDYGKNGGQMSRGLFCLFAIGMVLYTWLIMNLVAPTGGILWAKTQLLQPHVFLLNIIPIVALVAIFYAIFNNLFYAGASAFLILNVLYMINRVKIQLRSSPFVPKDFLLAKEGANVMHVSALKGSWLCIVVILGSFLIMMLLGTILKSPKLEKKNMFFISLGSIIIFSTLILTVYTNRTMFEKINYRASRFNNSDVSNNVGFNYFFLHMLSKQSIDKPEGYDEAVTKAFIKEQTEATVAKSPEVKPNIVILQIEAFSDLPNWNNFNYTSADHPLKNFNAISKSSQAVHGYTSTFRFGGGTADTEFDVLTGMKTENVSHDDTYAFSLLNSSAPSLA